MIGAHIDNYRIIEKLGDGGMGSVYKAVDVMLEREVALKFLRPELAQQKDLVDRFRAEAIVLAKLSHQNIASLYGLHRHGDDLYMAMEYVPGDTLEALLKAEGTLGLERAVAVASDILQALDYAHKRGVVHRDVKSANVIVMPAGGVKVMDFGIARVLGTERHTRVGFVVGTIGYMAPEQIQGLDVDGRTDIYALGVVLYETLTGRMPFQGDTEYAIMQAQVQQMPVPPRVFAPVPVPVENAIMRALAKQPQERFQTAMEFHQALQTSLHQIAIYPETVAPFSASGDETREFKSDPQLLAQPAPPSGSVPVYPLPDSPRRASPTPPPRAPATTPPPPARPVVRPPQGTAAPPAAANKPSAAASREAIDEGDLDATTPISPYRGPSAPPPASGPAPPVAPPQAGPTDEVDPDATIVLRGTPAWGRPTPPSAARPAWDQRTLVTTPVPGPPPAPPSPASAPRPPTTPPPVPSGASGTGTVPSDKTPRPLTTPVPVPAADTDSVAVRPTAESPPLAPPPMTPAPAATTGSTPLVMPPLVMPSPPAARPATSPASPRRKGVSAGVVVLVAGVIVLGALSAAGYFAWQRWQQQGAAQQALEQGPQAPPVPGEPVTLYPPIDPGVAPLVPAAPPPPVFLVRTIASPPRAEVPPTVLAPPPVANLEPVPIPVPPTMVTPELKPASPEPPKAVVPPALFGDAKWMRVDGPRVREVDAILQLSHDDVRVLDERARGTLSRVPYSAISHVTYSSGKRPSWRKGVGPVPTDSAFDSTMRTFHYVAFQGASHFVLVRVDRDDLPRLRDEVKKRANLDVEGGR